MKNKKTLVVIVAVLLLLLISGLAYSKVGSKNTKLDSTQNNPSESGNVFTSVKDALSKKMTLVCEFNDESGISTKSYIKNGAVRVSSSGTTGDNQSSDIIMKDKRMYMWDVKTKQGFVYDIPDSENTNTDTNNDNSGSNLDQSESYLSMIDRYKDSCKVAAVEDSYFETPTDIKFQDMSKMLQDLKIQMPQTPTQ